ncbi:MAG: hypothetical protein A2Y12_07415 [Planctomycetes bacterium GWF2_42_9]|nr:MAG: hypothetical protein A2Y12_07415 [Planctomycetes bacterium GWF2_42_9]
MFKRSHYSDGKRGYPFWIFIVPIIAFVLCFPYLIKGNPGLTVIILIFLFITFIIISLYELYGGFITNHYVQKHNLNLWKKSKSHSLRERQEAGKEINSLVSQIPCLEKHSNLANKIAFRLLTIWTLIFIVISLFIILL